MHMVSARVTILGAFFVDLACRTDRMPDWGETMHGKSFAFGPGGKGSNQAVAAARLGASVEIITRIGADNFGDVARRLFASEGIATSAVATDPDTSTGTATIIIDDSRGENAIIITPGACDRLSISDVEAASALIANSAFFVSQLELPLASCLRGIEIAHGAGVPVILNPAPAVALPPETFARISYLTPNETEAAILAGVPVNSITDAATAAKILRNKGVGTVLITLGAQGVYVSGPGYEGQVPAAPAGPVLDTTGAGDAFNGGFVTALAEGATLREATQFGCAVAGLAVTRAGAASGMPTRAEVEALTKSL